MPWPVAQTPTTPPPDDAENEDLHVILRLPASVAGHDLTFTMSPRKKQAASAAQDQPPPASGLPTSGPGTATGGEDPFELAASEVAVPAVVVPLNDTPYFEHRSISVDIVDVFERHAVPDEFKELYPADPLGIGWKVQKWYIVRRGLETGIFHDFWCVDPGNHMLCHSHSLVGLISILSSKTRKASTTQPPAIEARLRLQWRRPSGTRPSGAARSSV
jgi:hypothetical protein